MAKSQNSSGPRYKLVWGPEGKPIAEVDAPNARAAVRKAPMPYRKYLGEIYAELLNPNAYVAVITLESDGFLLGGTRKHESSPFALEYDAKAFAWQSKQVNLDRPGYQNAIITTKIVPVFSKNPIPASI